MKTAKTLLIINGSRSGNKGNCNQIIKTIVEKYSTQLKIDVCHLKSSSQKQTLTKLKKADILLFVTGTYWESWGSPLQKFLEDFSEYEATSIFMGKPTGCLVLAHSTGGKSVLSRLQGNLNLFGCLIPPLCGMEYTLVNQIVLTKDKRNVHIDDLWSLKDIDSIISNLILASNLDNPYKSWKTDNKNFKKVWIKTKK